MRFRSSYERSTSQARTVASSSASGSTSAIPAIRGAGLYRLACSSARATRHRDPTVTTGITSASVSAEDIPTQFGWHLIVWPFICFDDGGEHRQWGTHRSVDESATTAGAQPVAGPRVDGAARPRGTDRRKRPADGHRVAQRGGNRRGGDRASPRPHAQTGRGGLRRVRLSQPGRLVDRDGAP